MFKEIVQTCVKWDLIDVVSEESSMFQIWKSASRLRKIDPHI